MQRQNLIYVRKGQEIMPQKDVEIPRTPGGTLKANLYTTGGSPANTPFVILCHGFTGDMREWDRFPKTAEKLTAEGFDAIIFDFSGSGSNPREPITLSKQVKDLEDVYGWVKQQGYVKISTIGLSFGGLTALVADLPDRVSAVFWAPGFYIENRFNLLIRFLFRIMSVFKKSPVKIKSPGHEKIWVDYSFVQDLLDTDVDEFLVEFKTPSLIIQGTADTAVKPRHTRMAFQLMPIDEHHQLVEVPGATHVFQDAHLDKFITDTVTWLKKYH